MAFTETPLLNRRAFLLGAPAVGCLCAAPEPPIRWMPPPGFDARKPGLGLPPFPGAEHTLIYDPRPSSANLDEGGSGKYESLVHGTFNHHPRILIYHGHAIVWWTNHSRDENGPGQRVLARYGTVRESGKDIQWGGTDRIAEVAPPAVPVRRRPLTHAPRLIFEVYPQADLTVINDRLYLVGKLVADHGWSSDAFYHGFPSRPVPAGSWSDTRDLKRGFRYDVWWDCGSQFAQQWGFREGRLVPFSPLYALSPPRAKIEVAEGRIKDVLPPGAPYHGALPLDRAPRRLREDVLHGRRTPVRRDPRYAPDTSKIAADGKNALAHHAEFRRPDGRWVVIRDNLLNGGYYYAAVKDKETDNYPPAVRTNLYGHAMPAAGELPDGRPWILCNTANRYDMYLTLSRDGITFDRSWLVLHIRRAPDGGLFKAGGPQYFQTAMAGGNIWVAYSITKEQIGVTKIPIAGMLRG